MQTVNVSDLYMVDNIYSGMMIYVSRQILPGLKFASVTMREDFSFPFKYFRLERFIA